LCGIAATALGQLVLMPYIKKKGWRFLIIASLAFIMAGSLVATISVGIFETVSLVNHGGSIGLGNMCPHSRVHHLGGAS
jgi:hypothetical protein